MLQYMTDPYFFMRKIQKILAVITCILIGFVLITPIVSYMTVTASVPKEKCYLCGNNDRSLMPYYKKFKSVGIWNLGTMDICDTRVRTFSEDGKTETYESGGTNINSYANGNSVTISSMADRGISSVDITYGDNYGSEMDTNKLKKYLCNNCLEKVRAIYEDAEKFDSKCSDMLLVDFVSLELYGLPEYILGGTFNEYYIHVDHEEDQKDSILIFYAPRKKHEE